MKNHEEPGWQRALWRYHCVSQVMAFAAGGKSLAEAVSLIAEAQKGSEKNVSRSSLYRWYRDFQTKGLDGLFDEPRTSRSRCLSKVFLDFLKSEKEADPDASLPEVIERARERHVIDRDDRIDRSTVYRAARAMNLPMFRRARSEATKMRPFAYKHRMTMVLCDGKIFRAGSERRKRVVIFFIDDATRYVLDAFVGQSEDTVLFLRGLYSVIERYGLMQILYLDRGPGFRSDDTHKVVANLGIPLVHGKARYPQGHAKVERFHGTVTQDVLRALQKPEIDPGCEALRIRFLHYIRERYHKRYHRGINDLPEAKWKNDSHPLSFVESLEKLKRAFVLSETRKVSRDNVIPWDGLKYEVPLGYSGRRVMIYRNALSGKIWMLHEGKATYLAPPDLSANARDRHRSKGQVVKEKSSPSPTTAAELHFNRDFSSIVGPDGGFPSQPDHDN